MNELGLVDEVREHFGRTAYTHKTHAKMADWLDEWFKFWFWADIACLAASSTGVIATVLATVPKWAQVATAVLTTVSLFLTLYFLKSDAQRRISKHRDTEAALWPIREAWVSILSDLKDGAITVEEARAKRDDLLRRMSDIYSVAPQTNGRAYAAAQRALKQNEELTFSTMEIDIMLPESLRKAPLPAKPDQP